MRRSPLALAMVAAARPEGLALLRAPPFTADAVRRLRRFQSFASVLWAAAPVRLSSFFHCAVFWSSLLWE